MSSPARLQKLLATVSKMAQQASSVLALDCIRSVPTIFRGTYHLFPYDIGLMLR